MNKFQQGDIVYWCHSEGTGRYKVRWGRIAGIWKNEVHIEFLHLPENRFVNGIPIDEFQSEKEFRRLPRGWTYNTPLFEITYKEYNFDPKSIHIDDSKAIKDAYDRGDLVNDRLIFWGNIEADIKGACYRLIKTYPQHLFHYSHEVVPADRLYRTYAEAKAEGEAQAAEFQRQVNLSDTEWSLEQIDKTLYRWQQNYHISDEEVRQKHDYFAALPLVEDVVVRLFKGKLQWKYDHKKQWQDIEL